MKLLLAALVFATACQAQAAQCTLTAYQGVNAKIHDIRAISPADLPTLLPKAWTNTFRVNAAKAVDLTFVRGDHTLHLEGILRPASSKGGSARLALKLIDSINPATGTPSAMSGQTQINLESREPAILMAMASSAAPAGKKPDAVYYIVVVQLADRVG